MRKKNNNPNNNGNKKNTNKNQKQNNNKNSTRRKNNNVVNNKNRNRNKNVNNNKKKKVNKSVNTTVNKSVVDKFAFVTDIDIFDDVIVNDSVNEETKVDDIVEEDVVLETVNDENVTSVNDKSVEVQVDDVIVVDSYIAAEEVKENVTLENEPVNKFEFVASISSLLDDSEKEEVSEEESDDLIDDAYNQIVDEEEIATEENIIPEMDKVINDGKMPTSTTISENLSSGKVITGNDKKKLYFGFESRVVIMLVAILLLFLVACCFVFEAVTSSGNKVVYYDENSSVDYKVCVTQNEFYKGNCLDSGMKYLSTITDTIPTTFKYDVDFSTEIEYDLDYRVVGVLKVVDKNDSDKVLYTTEDVLVQSTELKNIEDGIHFETNVEIPYKKYNQFITDYMNKYSLSANAYFDVILYLDENTGERALASINIPLGVSTYSITEKLTSNENRNVEIATQEWNAYSVSCAIFGVLCILTSLILVMRLTSLVTKVVNNRNDFQKHLNKVLRENDNLIVIAKDGYEISKDKKKVKVADFKELVDARNAVNKPIIYSKINDVKSEFYVEDNDIIYYYVMKEADFGGK